MKKTLKILMAIILFAVVLTIATSVNAVTYANLDKAIQEEQDLKEADDTHVPAIEIKDGSYVVNAAVEITDKITITNMKLKLDQALTLTNGIVFKGNTIVKAGDDGAIVGNIQNDGTLTVPSEIGTKLVNKGTLYISDGTTALTNKTENSDNGVIYCDAASTAVTGNVQLTLKDEVRHDDVTYTKITVPTKDIDKKLDYKVTEIIKDGDVAATNKVEAGKKYTLKVKVTFDGKEIVDPDFELVAPKNFDAKQNCTIETDKQSITVVAKKDLDGNTITLGVQLTGVADSKKDLASIPVGTEIKPEEPTQPEEPTNPEEPAKPSDDKKGDLDDAAAVATGDHIIPATALLAVVVVANVVYFAKSKNN